MLIFELSLELLIKKQDSIWFKLNKRLQVALILMRFHKKLLRFILNESRTPSPPQQILSDTHYTINITQEHALTNFLYPPWLFF